MRDDLTYKLLYYILSLISGFLEVGFFIYFFNVGFELYWLPFIGVFYQLGIVFNKPINLSQRTYLFLAFSSIIIFIFFRNNVFLILISIFMIASPLQFSRKFLQKKISISTFKKRIFRVSGFLISFSINIITIFIAIIFIILACIVINKNYGQKNYHVFKIIKTKTNNLAISMIFHQMHYFSYCYMLIIIFYFFYNLPVYMISLAFSIGWISYLSSPKILDKNINYYKLLILGHIIVIFSLVCMYLYRSISILIIFWFITGFGGGTVFTIKKMIGRYKEHEKFDLEFHENIGHFLGVLITSILFLFTKFLFIPFILGALFALSVIIIIFIEMLRLNSNE